MTNIVTFAEFQHRQQEKRRKLLKIADGLIGATEIKKSTIQLAVEAWLDAGNGRRHDKYHPENK